MIEADYLRLQQENERLWKENSVLRPRVSELEHQLRIAQRHLKAFAEAETASLIRKIDDHG